MPIYKNKLSIQNWKPIYFNSIIESLRVKFGCGEFERLYGENYIQVTFYDSNMLNADKLVVTLTFIKIETGCDFTFFAASDYINIFDWDISTESNVIKKYLEYLTAMLFPKQ